MDLSRPMRVLFVAACPLPWPRGTPIRIHRMAEALMGRGHEVHVATYPRGDDRVGVSYQLHRVGSTASRLDTRPGPSLEKFLWLDPMLLRRVNKLLRSRPFDVIHAHHYEGLIAALCARRGRRLPLVYDAHTLLANELPHYGWVRPAAVASRMGGSFDRRLPPRADHVIAVTERMRRWFAAGGGIAPVRLSLIPNGVEHEHFDGPRRASLVRPRPGHGPTVLFAGNLAAYQGIGYLLDAFARVRARVANARLVLVTESPLDAWRWRIHALGISPAVEVVRSDYRTLPGYLHAADVAVNPRTDCDGIPQKLLNYMAAGRPIVSFAGSAGVLQHDRTGLLVPDGDVAAMAASLVRVLESPMLARRLGEAARRRVVAAHSWQHVAENVESVYLRLLASGTAAP